MATPKSFRLIEDATPEIDALENSDICRDPRWRDGAFALMVLLAIGLAGFVSAVLYIAFNSLPGGIR